MISPTSKARTRHVNGSANDSVEKETIAVFMRDSQVKRRVAERIIIIPFEVGKFLLAKVWTILPNFGRSVNNCCEHNIFASDKFKS